jgi:hypothetical protein
MFLKLKRLKLKFKLAVPSALTAFRVNSRVFELLSFPSIYPNNQNGDCRRIILNSFGNCGESKIAQNNDRRRGPSVLMQLFMDDEFYNVGILV